MKIKENGWTFYFKAQYKLVLINVFNVLLVEKYLDKKNHQNQQHYTFKLECIILFEICFHFAGHKSSTQEFSAGPSEFLPDLHFLCKIVLKPSNIIPLLLF